MPFDSSEAHRAEATLDKMVEKAVELGRLRAKSPPTGQDVEAGLDLLEDIDSLKEYLLRKFGLIYCR